MKRPDNTTTATARTTEVVGDFRESKTISVELNERSSRSLLANVLDLDDNFHSYYSGLNHELNPARTPIGSAHGLGHPCPPTANHDQRRVHDSTPTDINVPTNPLSVTLLQFILKELQYLTEKLRAEDKKAELCSDWKFAAMVIDRLCLWLFTVFTIVSTFAIMFSPPDILTRIYS